MADTLLGGIVINEILVDPNGTLNFDTDGNGTAEAVDEYVELYNTSAGPIDISGLELWDQGIGHWFTFPSGTILAAGGHAMVMSGVQAGGALPSGAAGDIFFDAGRASPLINNGGDNVTVYDPANDEYVIATFNGDAVDDPTLGLGNYAGFSATATQIGAGEDFGNDTDGLSVQRAGDGADVFATDGPTPGTTNICFADGTFIRGPDGDARVEDLRVGDRVLTADHGVQRIGWVFARTWSRAAQMRYEKLRPVRIAAGALGAGVPSADLRLSRQHRVLVQGPIAQRMFGCREVLIPAVALLSLPGVCIEEPVSDVTYFHIMLDRHEVIFANNAPTESIYLGAQALASIPRAALEEISVLLGVPVLDIGKSGGPVAPVRDLISGRRANRLVERHIKNGHPVLQPEILVA